MNYYNKIKLINQYSILKTLYYNLKYIPIKKVIKFPLIIGKGVKINIKGTMIIEDYSKKFIVDKNTNLNIQGILKIKGRCKIGKNSGIYVGKKGILSIGDEFRVTSSLSLNCLKEIDIGENVLISWQCTILDSDFHKIYDSKKNIINNDKKIMIRDNIWIGNNVIVLKGSEINHNCIIGAGSIVSGYLENENAIYVGNPIRKVKQNISWEH